MKGDFLFGLALLLISFTQVFSQTKPAKIKLIKVQKGHQVVLPDTVFIVKRDTTLQLTGRDAKSVRIRKNPSVIAAMFYDSLEQRASGSKVSNDIFQMVVKKRGNKERLVNAIILSESVFKPFEGQKIRSVSVKVVDILEGSVIDTLQRASTKVGLFVNKSHTDTRISIIEQNLLFKAGDTVDPYQMADNERVLRQFPPLRDARIYIARDQKSPGNVDVVVVVQDVSSIGFAGTRRSWKDFRFDLYHVNVAGLATQIQVSYFRNAYRDPNNGYAILLQNPNLGGTFLQGQVHYADNFIHKSYGASIGREFFTPEIKYAGAVSYYNAHENFYAEGYDTLEIPYSENNFEIWGGRSFEIIKRTNLIFAALINPRTFYNTQRISIDSNRFLHDRTLVLGKITIAKRNYMKSLRIRGFGRTEDIPIGGSFGIIGGREFNDYVNRQYFQADANVARYFPRVGYVFVNLSAGTFYRGGSAQDGILNLSTVAFSDLIRLKNTQMRNFIFFDLTKGLNREVDRSLQIIGKWRDEEGNIPIGNGRISIGLETDYFMPWYFYGFQFTLFYRGDLYLLSSDDLIDYRSIFYSVKAGVRTLNENLVLPAFSIDLTYFGKNKNFPAAWQIKFTTTLPDLFTTNFSFKPQVRIFE